jgi:hypothetical protein
MQRTLSMAKFRSLRVVPGLLLTIGPLSSPASAITVEVAKKCNVLVAKAFPPAQVGNPAAGRTKAATQSARDYFRECVAKDGNMEQGSPKQ